MVNSNDVREYIRIKEYILSGNPVYSNNPNIQEIKEFQKYFTSHYRVRCNNTLFYQIFEELRLQTNLNTPAQAFSIAIERLADDRNRNRIDFSFASKMISTIYDDMPIWDSFIARKLVIPEAPTAWPRNKRLEYTKLAYKNLCNFYSLLYQHGEVWNALIALFNNDVGNIPNINIVSDYRKIDFVLWSDEKGKTDPASITNIDSLICDILRS